VVTNNNINKAQNPDSALQPMPLFFVYIMFMSLHRLYRCLLLLLRR